MKAKDIDVKNPNQHFVSLKCGLIVYINVDWFQSLKHASYSTRTLWLTIDNLPQSICYLQENTFLLLVIPGPTEPNTEQLSGLLEPFVKELEQLGEGELFSIFGLEEQEMVYVALPFATMDTPSHLKTAGFVSQNSDKNMCPCCKAPFYSLVHPDCFDHSKFTYQDQANQLKWKYLHGKQSQDPETQTTITENKGVHMSILDCLPTWDGALSISTEIMHMFWGGGMTAIVSSLELLVKSRVILIEGSTFMGTGKQSEPTPLDRLSKFVASIWWPKSSGRFQLKIASGEHPKADEWSNFM
ncbi:hypothetical protein PAXRUDRAFT_28409 [Paxillus rubicundulus Ve08.2h10]|uniref:Uncharacterized protein n=1 Tax=Paxillus rubicundulus Ve08.2h10 TaxID=930991 RepID=A0A0D0C9A8_9AGAM|nr:hypothetical protein PAXRUDRAFT_28409 [Paxillus rubicundulus Ve08.2h10]